MAELMSELCEKGVELIWKQCNEALFPQGLEYLKEAAEKGDAEALFFLGHCCSWGDGSVGFNDKKAYEYYLAGAQAGSIRCVLGAARAGQYDDRMKRASRYSLNESFELVAEAAKRGDAFSAYQIAEAFFYEDVYEILPKSERWAGHCFKWYEEAGDGGIVKAMRKAGSFCFSGTYTLKNEKRGLYWAEKAAASGDAWGLLHMGLYTLERQEFEAAFAYFYAASCQGDETSPFYLGELYMNGLGIEQDFPQAAACFEEAARHENREALLRLGELYSEETFRDDEKAYYWYSRAYGCGKKEAGLALARFCLAPGEHRDLQKAESLLTEYASEDNHWADQKEACLLLGQMYEGQTEGMPETDWNRAVEYYERGAAQGSEMCKERLGRLYFEGETVVQDYDRAFLFLQECREKGLLQDALPLAFLYQNGYGCEKDERKAAELYLEAANKEKNKDAYYELGKLYERGEQIPQDLEQAVDYYRQAALYGHDGARKCLSHFKRNFFGKWKRVR